MTYLYVITLCSLTLWSRIVKMAVSGNKRKKDLLTDEDISKVVDKEDKSCVFSEESDGFGLIQVKKIQTRSWIQAVLRMKVDRMQTCQISRSPLYLMAWHVQDLHLLVYVE
jgi:hypothetical protein